MTVIIRRAAGEVTRPAGGADLSRPAAVTVAAARRSVRAPGGCGPGGPPPPRLHHVQAWLGGSRAVRAQDRSGAGAGRRAPLRPCDRSPPQTRDRSGRRVGAGCPARTAAAPARRCRRPSARRRRPVCRAGARSAAVTSRPRRYGPERRSARPSSARLSSRRRRPTATAPLRASSNPIRGGRAQAGEQCVDVGRLGDPRRRVQGGGVPVTRSGEYRGRPRWRRRAAVEPVEPAAHPLRRDLHPPAAAGGRSRLDHPDSLL